METDSTKKVKSGNPIVELYNLERDAQEQFNVAEGNPKKVEELREVIAQAHLETPNFPLLTIQQ
ncbi:hypothetical protein LZQ00_16935 [Sphingobacterium sp. SRCM116780]|uniref:hypothetical protein n=1 Tax=Sphingobacterium sp. SRCM116780 TaxID=2907623 RepID=UPI001F2AD50F|nr:hypothetical protein [Sphingobacterium sp. SRCM116780]UIR55934.1 hypothetical protein LZQ00_16935 [Sphingobacterium sp. SRCM116780]